MNEVEKIMDNTSNRLENLCRNYEKRLSSVDKEINDIYHFIEFTELDAYRGWKAYKLLKDKLRKRREIKDGFDAAIRFRKSINAKTRQIKNDTAIKKYTPRKIDVEKLINGGEAI